MKATLEDWERFRIHTDFGLDLLELVLKVGELLVGDGAFGEGGHFDSGQAGELLGRLARHMDERVKGGVGERC